MAECHTAEHTVLYLHDQTSTLGPGGNEDGVFVCVCGGGRGGDITWDDGMQHLLDLFDCISTRGDRGHVDSDEVNPSSKLSTSWLLDCSEFTITYTLMQMHVTINKYINSEG